MSRAAAARAAHPLLLRRPPGHGQGAPPGVDAQLPGHHPAPAVLRRRRQEDEDHQAQGRGPDLRPGPRVPSPPGGRPRQSRPHPQPTPGRAAHPVRLHRQPGAARCSASASRWRRSRPSAPRRPRRTSSSATRSRRCSVTLPRNRTPRPARPRPAPVPLQHRGTGRKRSPTCASATSTSGEYPVVRLHGKGDKWRTCPLWRQTAAAARRAARLAEHDTSGGHTGVLLRDRRGADPLRHLQDRAAPRRAPRRRPAPSAG